ncbi:MAG: hypothetical protein FWE67_07225 [Planctomycetaceae bacterium]|nr:hypothetical protein [Planctomycetaceae bacterium]
MLETLDTIDWSSLEHAYGFASDVPCLLRDIICDCRERQDRAFYELHGNVVHQGTIYGATPHTIPFLVEILNEPSITDAYVKEGVAGLLAAIAAGRGYCTSVTDLQNKDYKNEIDRQYDITEKVRIESSKIFPMLIPFLENEDYSLREIIAEAIPFYPEHYALALPALERAESAETDEVVKELMCEALEFSRQNPAISSLDMLLKELKKEPGTQR